MSTQHNYIYYGTSCTSKEVESFLEHTIATNARAEANGRPRTPLCIWGQHGIGKTQLVQQVAEKQGYKWAYIAPAQFEEMGDLVGMPRIEAQNGDTATVFSAPEWVPREEGPGILLIDDVNRADDRILRGIMQLLQNYELVSWKLPPKWQIVLTANPDGGDYSVTPLDFAMLTRMMHITMVFDVKRWAWWAEKNGVDPRGISFVLTYPETVTGDRTTPRTLVQFFESISGIKDLNQDLALVKMLGDACLDPATVSAFISFVNHNLARLIAPEEILGAEDFREEVYEPVHAQTVGETKRIDILSVITTRLVNHVTVSNHELDDRQRANLIDFLLMDFLPNDIRLIAVRDIANCENNSAKKIVADPRVSGVLLGSGKWATE